MEDDHRTFKHLRMNDNFSLPSKPVSVPKESDKSPFIDLLADGFASEMLVIEFIGGDAIAYPYHLLSKLTFSPTKELVIQFNDETVSVEGTTLSELFRYLTRHQVVVMREREHRGFDTSNGKLSIKKISVKTP